MSTLQERTTPPPRDEEPPRRPRSRLRDGLHALSTVLMVSGVLLLADAGLTIVWQEPLSAVYNHFQQSRLSGELRDNVNKYAPTPLERKALRTLPDAGARIAFAARALDRKIQPGQPLGRLRIKAIGLNDVVVEGTTTDILPKGPGHYPATPLPGAPGTVAFAGHRTTYGAPFRHVDSLRKGDRIVFDMPYAKVTYAVERLRIVKPTDTWVTNRVGYNRLVLTACNPLYSAAQRIVVFARQVSAVPSRSLF